MNRPRTLVVVTGTGTEVGKTWVSAHLLAELATAGTACAARKPAQSFEESDASPRDADVLAAATGEDPSVVCPPGRNYAVAMAPPMAADVLGAGRIEASGLLAEIDGSWPVPTAELGLVELAGGVRSPITHDADCGELTAMLSPTHVLLVADAGLGTINAVMSSLDSLEAAGAIAGRGTRDITSAGGRNPTVMVYLNRYDDGEDLHRRNREWLTGHGCGPVPVTPSQLALDVAPPPRFPRAD